MSAGATDVAGETTLTPPTLAGSPGRIMVPDWAGVFAFFIELNEWTRCGPIQDPARIAG